MKHRLALIISVFLLALGCAQIPKQELSQYKQAFSELRIVSEDILLDYDQALQKSREIVAKRQENTGSDRLYPRTPYPTNIQKFESKYARKSLDNIEVRRQALRVITRYNDVLTQLVEGKSVNEVRTSSAGLVKTLGKYVELAAGSSVPGLSGIASVISILAEQFEKARLRKEFEAAVREGSPVVAKILDTFIKDREDHYRLRVSMAQEQRLLILNQMVTQAAMIRDLITNHTQPSQSGEDIPSLTDIEQELNSLLKPAEDELINYPFKLEFSITGQPVYSRTVHALVIQSLSDIRYLGAIYADNVNQIKSIGMALVQYRILLNKTKAAIQSLNRALEEPQDIASNAEDLLVTVFRLKRELEAFRTALRSAQ